MLSLKDNKCRLKKKKFRIGGSEWGIFQTKRALGTSEKDPMTLLLLHLSCLPNKHHVNDAASSRCILAPLGHSSIGLCVLSRPSLGKHFLDSCSWAGNPCSSILSLRSLLLNDGIFTGWRLQLVKSCPQDTFPLLVSVQSDSFFCNGTNLQWQILGHLNFHCPKLENICLSLPNFSNFSNPSVLLFAVSH